MNRDRVLLGVIAVLTVAPTFGGAQISNDAAGMPWEATRTTILKKFEGLPPTAQQTEPFKIVDNVAYVGLATVASYLIPTNDGLILVDATYADTADLVLDRCRPARGDDVGTNSLTGTRVGHAHDRGIGNARVGHES